MKISDHAFRRFFERKKRNHYEKAIREIEQSINKGKQVTPANGALAAIVNGFKETEYYKGDGVVYVVREKTIVSVLEYNSKEWNLVPSQGNHYEGKICWPKIKDDF